MVDVSVSARPLVLLSGGFDSVVACAWAINRWGQVDALTINYGQRHDVELEAARKTGEILGVTNHSFINLVGAFAPVGSLLRRDIEPTQYESVAAADEKAVEGIDSSFIPARNAVFLSIAASRAWVGEDRNIRLVTGMRGGFPDCREPFMGHLARALSRACFDTDDEVLIYNPLAEGDRAWAVRLARDLPKCWEALRFSHTCFNGKNPPCGHCLPCLKRAEGFAQAGEVDPIIPTNQGIIVPDVDFTILG